MIGVLDNVRARLRHPPTPATTTRYHGPSWEYRRARVLERLEVDLVLDVGANAGQYGVELRGHGYQGTIVSFEPGSAAFAELVSASAADGRWHVRRLALGTRPGSATLNIAANDGKSSSLLAQRGYTFGTTSSMGYVGAEEVELTTLDAVAGELIGDRDRALLKLDVQGFELAVLEGGSGALAQILAIETELALLGLYEDHAGWREVCDRMRDAGFELFALDPGYSDWESGRLVEMDALFVRAELAELR
ncbi:MAG: FkbM family methyltransferase [Solirubrobacteraceae bacterium]